MNALRALRSRTPLLAFMLLLTQVAVEAGQTSAPCKVGSLPSDVRSHLDQEYASWKIQEPTTLSRSARERWESEKPLECPGIAVGNFEGGTKESYALLLVPRARPDAGYRFLVFSQREGHPSYEIRVLDKFDGKGAANYFIHTASISKFFDEASRKKFSAHAAQGVLLVDSAENEYGVDVYFWSGDRYRHEPIDY